MLNIQQLLLAADYLERRERGRNGCIFAFYRERSWFSCHVEFRIQSYKISGGNIVDFLFFQKQNMAMLVLFQCQRIILPRKD